MPCDLRYSLLKSKIYILNAVCIAVYTKQCQSALSRVRGELESAGKVAYANHDWLIAFALDWLRRDHLHSDWLE